VLYKFNLPTFLVTTASNSNRRAIRTTVGDVANGEARRLLLVVGMKSNRDVSSATDERKWRVKMAAHPVHV